MTATMADWQCPTCGELAPIFAPCPRCAGSPAARGAAASAQGTIERARAAFERGRLALCVRVLRSEPWPDAPAVAREGARLLGLACARQGRWLEALDPLERAAEAGDDGGDDGDVTCALAESLAGAGSPLRALALLERDGGRARDPAGLRRLRARIALGWREGDRAALATTIERDAEADPGDAALRRAAAEIRLELARAARGEPAAVSEAWSRAQAHAAAVFEAERSVQAALWLVEALAHARGAADPEIVRVLEAVGAAGAEEPAWHRAWIESLIARGEGEAAQVAARAALERFPEHPALTELAQRAAREAWARKRAAILAARNGGADARTAAIPDELAALLTPGATEGAASAGDATATAQFEARGEVPSFLTDLRQQLARGALAPVRPLPDRQREVLEVLCRAERANAVVTGPAGCGKSALLRAVARQLATGEGVPDMLKSYGLYAFDVIGVIGRYVGTVEERLAALTRFCETNRVVLFIDDAQLLVGAGSYDNRPAGLSETLQPLMSSGTVKLVAATTHEGYEQLARSSGFDRRVTRIGLPAMDVEGTVSLLAWMRPRLEQHYQRVIDEGLLAPTARLAEHHVTGRVLPDSAIDLVERACAKALFDGDAVLTHDHVVRALAQMLRVPLEQVQLDRMSTLLRLEELLSRRVLGQDDAVRTVADVVRMSKAGLDLNPYRPDGAFLFVGPSGVGKTELARALAEALNPDASGFVRLDMGEFSEPHLASRLFGTSAGLVGYERDGQLSGALRANPSAVVLLDEIEKAHPNLFDAFLQVFDAGRLTDGRGQVVDCSRATFIMTSNVGTAELSATRVGFERLDSRRERARTVRTALEKTFRPEFLNRLDAVVVFDALAPETLRRVVGQKLDLLRTRFATRGVELVLDDALVDLLLRDVEPTRTGARGLMRAIEQRLAIPLTRAVLADPARRAFTVALSPASDDAIRIE